MPSSVASQAGAATGLALWTATLSAALVAAVCITLFGASSAGASTGPDQEIDALLARLERSPCSFRRNNQWHDGATASAHLRRKWRMGAMGRAPASAEQFVELAGSRSNESGAEYRVRCPGESEQPAGPWLLRHLDQLRRGYALGP